MSNDKLDEYLEQVIGKGDEGSHLLAKLTAPTLKNCEYVDVVKEGMNGVAVLNHLPKDDFCVVHSAGGDPSIAELVPYVESMVDRLVETCELYDMTPLAFANVVDASKGEKKEIELIGETLARKANEYRIAILNGELAILGNRVNTTANINGTMVSIAKKDNPILITNDFGIVPGEVRSALFDHQGKPVWINSDGRGTKSEFSERIRNYEPGLLDSLAMKLDDLAKLGATAKVVSDVVEIRGDIRSRSLETFARELSRQFGMTYILQFEDVGTRIQSFAKGVPAYNISGSSVSIIDEERLRNPPIPHEGEYLVAIRGAPNPRANGMTEKRKTMVKLFGEDYHITEVGKIFLAYLAAPSTVFYPVFKDLIDQGLATSVYHMSGGAYNGKLARPIAKHGLFAGIENLFAPDWRELALGGAAFTSAQTAYAKWPMGNEGFVTTTNADAVIDYLKSKGLEGRVVGRLEKRDDGKTGVELTAFNGEKVSFSGK